MSSISNIYSVLYHTQYWCAILSHFSDVQLFVTLRPIVHQAPLAMGFSRQVTGVDCHALLQGIFPTQGLNPHLMSPALADGFFTTSATWEAQLLSPCSRDQGRNCWIHTLQLLKPRSLRACALQWEANVMRSPCTTTREQPPPHCN